LSPEYLQLDTDDLDEVFVSRDLGPTGLIAPVKRGQKRLMTALTRRVGPGQVPPRTQATRKSNLGGNGTPGRDTDGTVQSTNRWAILTRRHSLELELVDAWVRASTRQAA